MALTKTKKYILLTCIIIIAVILYKLLNTKDTTIQVRTEQVLQRTITETVENTGKLYPSNEVKLTADLGSTVTSIYVQEGDTVQQGAAIATVTSEYTSMVSGATNNSNAGIQNALKNATLNPAAIAQAMQQASVPTAAPTLKKQTKTNTLYASITGIVTVLNVKKGDRILSAEIGKLCSINEWEIRTDIGEMDIVKLNIGNIATIKIDALNNYAMQGSVVRITNNSSASPIASFGGSAAESANYKVIIKLPKDAILYLKDTMPNYTLRAGMNASVKVTTRTLTNVLSIPLKAITTRYTDSATANQKANTVVFTYNNGKALQHTITTGLQDMEYIQVTSGLLPGSNIITEPFEALDKLLQNGEKVKLLPKKY